MDSFQRIKLGAIDKKTGLFVSPFKASKENEYKCPDCDNDVILKQGDIRKYHFSHKPDSDCSHYNAGENAIHKNGKIILKTLLESPVIINIFKKCNKCYSILKIQETTLSKNESVKEEYRFSYENSIKIADIAKIVYDTENNSEYIKNIFEIMYTHQTNQENRPEPWYEIDAVTLSIIYNSFVCSKDNTFINIPCIREFYCDKCKQYDNSHNIYKVPTIDEQLYYSNDIESHLKHLKEYEEKYGELDLNYEWLKNHIKNIEVDTRTNKYLLENVNSWLLYLFNYMESKVVPYYPKNKYNQLQEKCIIDAVINKDKIFCQGPAGTGKSLIIKGIEYLSYLLDIKVFKLAPTGKAAKNINGITLHSFKNSLEKSLKNGIRKINKGDLIIIDEISMVGKKLMSNILSMIEMTENDIQVLYFGDFAQFPPIKDKYCIYSKYWNINNYIELTEIVRQREDKEFGNFLLKLRKGIVDDSVSIINSRTNPIVQTLYRDQRLFYQNIDKDEFNEERLKEIGEKIHTFYPHIETYNNYSYETVKEYEDLYNKYTLKISKGCDVFVIKNSKENIEIVNGLKASVEDITEDSIIIKYNGKDGNEHTYEIKKQLVYIKREKNEYKSEDIYDSEDEDNLVKEEENKKLITVLNFPLILGYASTLHKAQGDTMNIVLMLKGYKFEQNLSSIYVALTRPHKVNELEIYTKDKKYIDFTKIKPTEEQHLLINGYIYSCINCNKLMNCNTRTCNTCINPNKKLVDSIIEHEKTDTDTEKTHKEKNIKKQKKYYISNSYIEGYTFNIKEKLKKYGCIWESKLKKWKVPKNKTQLESLQNFLDNL